MADEFSGPMIRVENLVTHYGGRRILNHVNLDFPHGETMVILGGSGTGKSTLLRQIMRLETVPLPDESSSGTRTSAPCRRIALTRSGAKSGCCFKAPRSSIR